MHLELSDKFSRLQSTEDIRSDLEEYLSIRETQYLFRRSIDPPNFMGLISNRNQAGFWLRLDISSLAKGTNRVRVRGGVTPAPDGKDNDLGINCRTSHPVPFRPPSVPTTSGGTAASPVESNHSTGLEEREGTGCAESAPSSSRRRRIHATAAACAVWPAEDARAPPGSRRDRRLRDCFGDRAAG